MNIHPGIGLIASVIGQVLAFYWLLVSWPTPQAIFGFVLLLFVFTPLMFVFCLDLVRKFKARGSSVSTIIGRSIFSLPLIVLALLSLLISAGAAVAIVSKLLSERSAELVLYLPGLVALLCMFLFFGIGLLRVIVFRKHEKPLP